MLFLLVLEKNDSLNKKANKCDVRFNVCIKCGANVEIFVVKQASSKHSVVDTIA